MRQRKARRLSRIPMTDFKRRTNDVGFQIKSLLWSQASDERSIGAVTAMRELLQLRGFNLFQSSN